jgi:hypothetical protein
MRLLPSCAEGGEEGKDDNFCGLKKKFVILTQKPKMSLSGVLATFGTAKYLR